ncbi:hypothetical protein ACLOJK_023495 [Asimina triloba]
MHGSQYGFWAGSRVAISMSSYAGIKTIQFADAIIKFICQKINLFAFFIADKCMYSFQKLNRKLVHISAGLVFMLFWPMFSSRREAAFLAAVAPGVNIIRMLLLGLGIWKNDDMVKSISRHGDYRELLKGPLYYACTLTLATSIFWRSSPIAIAAICNLCAGDGTCHYSEFIALDTSLLKIVQELIILAQVDGVALVGYMHYFSLFGLVEESWGLVIGFLVVSLATAVVESLPISTELDDNLTVPLTALLKNALVFPSSVMLIFALPLLEYSKPWEWAWRI